MQWSMYFVTGIHLEVAGSTLFASDMVVPAVLLQFLIFDTQMVVGGQKRRYQLSPEEHIFGALQLYLDIVYIFLIVLSLVGGGRRS